MPKEPGHGKEIGDSSRPIAPSGNISIGGGSAEQSGDDPATAFSWVRIISNNMANQIILGIFGEELPKVDCVAQTLHVCSASVTSEGRGRGDWRLLISCHS